MWKLKQGHYTMLVDSARNQIRRAFNTPLCNRPSGTGPSGTRPSGLFSPTYYLLIRIGPMRTQNIAPSIPVCRPCGSSPPRMPSQLVSFLLYGSSPCYSRPASSPLTFRCPRRSRCCQDFSSKRVQSISIFSLL